MIEFEGGAIAALQNFYARQAHLIDSGQHEAWAETFVPEGEFHSPTYGEPAIGAGRLRAISQAFSERAAQAGERHRHLVQNVWACRIDQARAEVRACLLITGTDLVSGATRLLRVVTLDDQLEKTAKGWQIRCRKVSY